ncbi:MAG: DNA topoisomerase I [archaeon]
MPPKKKTVKSGEVSTTKTKKTTKSKTVSKPASSIPSAKEKKAGYGNNILIVCEKPQAAEKIAAALSDGTDQKIKDKNGVAYYQFNKDGKSFLVGCAVGHLFGIKQNTVRGEFPSFDVSWQPNYETKGGAYTKKYYDVLKDLSRDSNEIIVATDYDTEGEVIGWNVVRFICKRPDARRMKFSSLTKDELQESWNNLQPTINWGEAYAGETRHFLDWFYGINLSRGLMRAISKTGQFRILSIGRVQGPALNIIYEKEMTIDAFKPEPYWQVFLKVRDLNKQRLEVKFPKDLTSETELARFKYLKGQKGNAKTEIKQEEIAAPIPFDLTTLQTEAYRYIGLTPSQTLSTAQALYLDGVISYPRTSSQQYPEGIGYEKILNKLKKYTTLGKYAINKKPTAGLKTDPAHPAIYPTGESKEMNETEKKLYDLIVKRFISCFCAAAITDNTKVVVSVNGLDFNAKGMKIIEKNWMHVYPNSYKEEEIPIMNGEVSVEEIRTEEKMTKPPQRYSAASLVKELERRDLGTKATRSNIVETLYDRGYIREKSIELTQLGKKIIETLQKYSPTIIDEELTREIEKEMGGISESKSDWPKKEEKVMEVAKVSIRKIAKGILDNLDKIGNSLAEANAEVYKQQREENTLTECPVCHKGKLRIMFSRKTKKSFISCNAYPDCKTIFSLPPTGMMKPAKRKVEKMVDGEMQDSEECEPCQECGFPMMLALKRGKRPWKFCFNPKCKTNEAWAKKREEYLKSKESDAKPGEDGLGKEEETEEEKPKEEQKDAGEEQNEQT